MAPKAKLVQRLKRENAKLRHLVFRDELTGLLNRRGFKELAEGLFEEIRWSMRHPDKRKSFRAQSFSILMADLDRFKRLNDRYGHDAGDKALQHVAGLINERVRGIDLVGRWGGEEIVIALLGADRKAAAIIAEDIRNKIASKPLRYRARAIPMTVSIGVAGLKNEKRLSDLIMKADKALYLAKKRGRNRVVSANHK